MKEAEKGKNGDNDDAQDYYLENGFVVFTSAYHLKRGYCCKNGCRHCPFGFKKTLKPTK